jgi:hypothetical protein
MALPQMATKRVDTTRLVGSLQVATVLNQPTLAISFKTHQTYLGTHHSGHNLEPHQEGAEVCKVVEVGLVEVDLGSRGSFHRGPRSWARRVGNQRRVAQHEVRLRSCWHDCQALPVFSIMPSGWHFSLSSARSVVVAEFTHGTICMSCLLQGGSCAEPAANLSGLNGASKNPTQGHCHAVWRGCLEPQPGTE